MKKVVISLIFSIATLLLMLITTSSFAAENVCENSIKLALVPDIHLSFNQKDDWILLKESPVIFQSVINDLNSRNDIDYVLFGGDLINNDDKGLNDIYYFNDILNDFKHRYFVIFGDREADTAEEFDKNDFIAEFKHKGIFDKDSYWINDLKNNYVLIGLDTSIKGDFNGEIDVKQMDWLKNQLELNKNKKVIILMHHTPIVNYDENFPKDLLLKNSGEFLKLVSAYPNIKFVISGHIHANSVIKQGSTYFISAPSVSTYPNMYKVLTIYDDRFSVEDNKISFNQLINISKNILPKTSFAAHFNAVKPENLIRFNEGVKSSKQKVYYF